jgi:hypothetical protein
MDDEVFVISKKEYQSFFSNLEEEMVIIPREKYQSLIDSLEDIKKYVEQPENQWKKKSVKVTKKIVKKKEQVEIQPEDDIDLFFSKNMVQNKCANIRVQHVYEIYKKKVSGPKIEYFTFLQKLKKKKWATIQRQPKKPSFLQGWSFQP